MTGIILNSNNHINELFKEKYFSDYFVHKINGRKFYIVKSIIDEMFVIAFCGNKDYEIAACTTHMITNFNLDSIIHIGFGENAHPEIKDYDVLLVSHVVNFENEKNYLLKDDDFYNNQIKFETNNEMNLLIKNILSTANVNYQNGETYPLYKKEKKIFNSHIPSVYDIESAPIISVCKYYEIACAIIKIKIDDYNQVEKLKELIDQLTYNVIQEISYNKLKNKNKEG